jgi:hypothetical protein
MKWPYLTELEKDERAKLETGLKREGLQRLAIFASRKTEREG